MSAGLSKLDFHLPAGWHGSSLTGESKFNYETIRSTVNNYYRKPSNKLLMDILDRVETYKYRGVEVFIPTMSVVVFYLRTQLLADPNTVFHTLVLLDVLVKNSGYILHALIGRERLMKTMSLVARSARLCMCI
jgi:hypothetical protein